MIEVELDADRLPGDRRHRRRASPTASSLDGALRRLDPRHRAVVVLHYFLGMPLPEVAACLGIPVGTAKSRLHYALSAMRCDRR